MLLSTIWKMDHTKINRRDFLKFSALAVGALGLQPLGRVFALPEYPVADRLGHVVWWGTELKTRPSLDSTAVRKLVEDELFPWIHEVVGRHPTEISQRWVETPEGYIWSLTCNRPPTHPNIALQEIPANQPGHRYVGRSNRSVCRSGVGQPACAALPGWISGLKPGSRDVCITARWSGWTSSRGMSKAKPGTGSTSAMGMAMSFGRLQRLFDPLQNKRCVPSVARSKISESSWTLRARACLATRISREVYFAACLYRRAVQRQWRAGGCLGYPAGKHPVWRKMVSLHMSGGTTGGGWDLPGIGWTTPVCWQRSGNPFYVLA